ncbi:MAG: hypothetical protein ACRDTH_02575 [Pseudonocardiaceae bacterium]
MDEYGVLELPAPVTATDSEVARLLRVLEDVRFSLERGCWQAALGTARAALTATRRPSDESAAHEHREQERVVLLRR